MTTHTTIEQDTATAAVDAYLAAWNERDAGRRAELVAAAWSEQGKLADPPMAAEGHEAIADMAAALHAQFPDHAFVRTSGVDEHHGFLRFTWTLQAADGSPALTGMDVGVLAQDGRLARVVGFFGDPRPRV